MQRSNQNTNALVQVCVGIAGGLLLLLMAGYELIGQTGDHTEKVPKTHNGSGIPEMVPNAHVGSTVNTLWDLVGIEIGRASVVEVPEGLATDLQLPWLQDIRRQLQGMKSSEAAQMRKEVERRIELVRLAALQRDLEAVTELQDEGLAAQARTYEELRSAKTDPEPPAAG
jgi:hypothetical protein